MNAGTSRLPFELRRLAAPDAACYRALRLEGLRSRPEAFGASWEDEAPRPLAWFAERLERDAVFGGISRTGSALVGVAGLTVPEATKLRHKGTLWGMFVRPEAQGAGLGGALVARVLEHAVQVVEEVQLMVGATNTGALRLYEHAGFRRYGLEQDALKIGGRYHDEVLMTLKLENSG